MQNSNDVVKGMKLNSSYSYNKSSSRARLKKLSKILIRICKTITKSPLVELRSLNLIKGECEVKCFGKATKI